MLMVSAYTLMWQAKVFSRFESLQKAVKNYTIEATPEDRSSVLQQVRLFCPIIKGGLTLCDTLFLNLFTLASQWIDLFVLFLSGRDVCVQREAIAACVER